MDPQECFFRMLRAWNRNDTDDAREAYSDLREWIDGGGFEPAAFEDSAVRAAFFGGYERIHRMSIALGL